MFSFLENYILENDVVRLSPLEEHHFEHLFDKANDKDIWQFFIENGYGRENFEQYLAKALKKDNWERSILSEV